jgi:hypothetical protein
VAKIAVGTFGPGGVVAVANVEVAIKRESVASRILDQKVASLATIEQKKS